MSPRNASPRSAGVRRPGGTDATRLAGVSQKTVWPLSVPRTSARRRCHPARLAGAAGVWYDEFSNLTEPAKSVRRPELTARVVRVLAEGEQ
jgi:hypothetical protein